MSYGQCSSSNQSRLKLTEMKRIVSLALVALINLKIVSAQENECLSFRIEDVIGNKKAVKLSDIVKNIHYIKLETTPESVLGQNNCEITPIDNFLFITQKDRALMLFDKQGKYIRTIGRIGRGPDEYSTNYSISLDIIGKKVFILEQSSGCIKVYSWEGKYLFDIKTEKPIIGFEYLKENLFCGYLKFSELLGPTDNNYIIFNDKGITRKGFHIPGRSNRFIHFPRDQSISLIPQVYPRFTSSPFGININTFQNDSLLKVTFDGNIMPALKWDLGKYYPKADLFDLNIPKAEREKYINSVSVIESNKYWFIKFTVLGKQYNCILEKKTNLLYYVDDKRPIKNDIDGGPSFWPFVVNEKGRIFAIPFYPIHLKKLLDDGFFDNSNVKFPDRNRQLKEMIKSLDINDNQIVMIVELF
jgi:hypothetical protein